MFRFAMMTLMGVLATGTFAAGEENWPRFRGENGAGVSETKNPPVKIDAESAVKWKVNCPGGSSSPVIWSGKIFLTAFDNGKLFTLAYDAKSGKELWRVEAPAKQIEKFYAGEGSPAASSCATDGMRVVSYFGSCGLFCYDLDGKPLWSFELPTAQTTFDFGSGTSPIIAEGMAILVRDARNGSFALALDLESGKQKWRTERNAITAYSTPTVFGKGADALLIVPGSIKMTAYELATGKEKWTQAGLPSADCTSAVTDGTRVYYAGWSPGGDDFKMPTFDDLLGMTDKDKDGVISKEESANSFLAQGFDSVDKNADGKLTREEWQAAFADMAKGANATLAIDPLAPADKRVAWKASKGLPYVPTPVLHQGKLFYVRDGGLCSCYDAATGKPLYESKRAGSTDRYYASPIAAGDYVYLASLERGTLSVIKPFGPKPEVVTERAMEERIAATPALVDGKLYVRTGEHLYCFGAD